MMLSPETKRRLTLLNTFVNDGGYPIEPMQPERPRWNDWVSICGAAIVVALAAWFWIKW